MIIYHNCIKQRMILIKLSMGIFIKGNSIFIDWVPLNFLLKTMLQEEKNKIIEYCNKNLHAHTDWTGIRIETKYQCESVNLFIDRLSNYIEEL